jgi:hypothetical protein
MEYKVVASGGKSHEEAVQALAKSVNRELQEGWVPTGGVSFAPDSSRVGEHMVYTAVQALIKTE